MTLVLLMTVMGLRIEPKIQDTDICACKPMNNATYRCFVEETAQSKIKIVTVLDERNLPAESKVKLICSKNEESEDDEGLVLE